jgi:hypothetical protein
MTEHGIDFLNSDDAVLRALLDADSDLETATNNGSTPGSFTDRVHDRRVNLLDRIRDGIPPADYLPASEHMLRRGKRHHWAAPKKVGKSIGALVHIVDMAIAGSHTTIFDRENGADLYASRLEAIIDGRDLDNAAQETLAASLHYYEFPRFRKDDHTDLAALCAGSDLVIFDSQRMYLSDLGLEENSSDDYAEFMAALIDPLFQVNIATLILDNTGHNEPRRGRGASSKGDLNEILFVLETVEKFSLDTAGRLRLEITDSRFGNSGRWEMEIGDGTFGAWTKVEHEAEAHPDVFRPTGKMERASIFVENCAEPTSRNTILDAVGGNRKYARIAIDTLVREHYFRSIDGARGAKLVESIRPYREADDAIAQANEANDRDPDRDPQNPADRDPDRDPPEPDNHAGSLTGTHQDPTGTLSETLDRDPGGGFPYGEPPAPDPVTKPLGLDDDIPF